MAEPEVLLSGDPDYNQDVEFWRAYKSSESDQSSETLAAFRVLLYNKLVPEWVREALNDADDEALPLKP